MVIKEYKDAVHWYNSGMLLYNDTAVAFRFNSSMYVPISLHRTQAFSFDGEWSAIKISWFKKLRLVMSGRYKVVVPCAKSLNAGVRI